MPYVQQLHPRQQPFRWAHAATESSGLPAALHMVGCISRAKRLQGL